MKTKIFLTGITGLVGSSFVTALLNDRPDTEFVCLTRGGRNRTAADRVAEAVRGQCEFDGTPERYHDVMRRIEVIDGDVVTLNPAAVAADPKMDGVTIVFHCAADVNLSKDPTGKTFRINFNGTENVLALAKLIKAKEFHYVSTAYVAGRSHGISPETQVPDNGFNNPYEESKFKAEQLVRASGFPFTIYRPAIITGRRSDGSIRKPLAFYRILEFLAKLKSHRCSKLGISPLEDIDLEIHFRTVPSERVYFVPIDFVQYAVTKCFQKPVSNQTYHVTGDSPVSTMMIDRAVAKTIGLKELTISDDAIAPNKDEKLMERFLGDLFPYFSADIVFAQNNIRAALGNEALDWKFGEKELEIMMKRFFVDFFPNVEWIQQVIKR